MSASEIRCLGFLIAWLALGGGACGRTSLAGFGAQDDAGIGDAGDAADSAIDAGGMDGSVRPIDAGLVRFEGADGVDCLCDIQGDGFRQVASTSGSCPAGRVASREATPAVGCCDSANCGVGVVCDSIGMKG